MTAMATATDTPSRDKPSMSPLELSFPAPKAPHTNIHMHLTFLATSTLLFLTTSTLGDSPGVVKALGSFVYAMPDRIDPRNTLCTPLCTASQSSIDCATRTAKILSRRMNMPVYVGCSADFSGSTVEEEMEGLTKTVEMVLAKWYEQR